MKQKYYKLTTLFLIILTVIILFRHRSLDIFDQYGDPPKKDQFAFITSSYYYPESKSLGSNALALLITMNLLTTQPENETMPFMDRFLTDKMVILAENATHESTITTDIQQVTTHGGCRMVVMFVTAQVTPNVQRISLVSGDEKTVIPFSTPNRKKRDAVFCIAPIFVSESWQNFLFSAHIYKHFGAHMHLYLSSAVTSFYSLLREYEKHDYVTLQAWTNIGFPGVSKEELDWVEEIEFRNQAASQSDCILQYKESAEFVGLVDFDDVLIPKLAPTYIEEFQHYMKLSEKNLYIFYDKRNYDANTVPNAAEFSFLNMLKSLEYQHAFEVGKIVTPPGNLNCTWIHNPPRMQERERSYYVRDNAITHLKNIDFDLMFTDNLTLPHFMNTSDLLISEDAAKLIETDLRRMFDTEPIKQLLDILPKEQFYGDLIRKCYHEVFYKFFHNEATPKDGKMRCSGPGRCKLEQRPDIQCVHVNATYLPTSRKYPITYYYSTDPFFTKHMGCHP